MYSNYVARQAIFNRNSKAIGYELLFRECENNQFPEIDQDIASSKLIIENHIHGDIAALTMDKLAFINFTEKCLINKYPLMFDPKTIVIELVGHSAPSERLVKIVQFYKRRGYKIALTEYDTDEQWDILFPYIKFIKINIEQINPKRLKVLSTRIKPFDIKLVAERVETALQLQSLAEIGFDFFQGFFYHKPEIVEGRVLAPIKTQMLNLMSETFKTPLDFDSISEIISQDVNLSVGLLKLVNNVMTGTRVEITSIKQAATYLGEAKVKQFVSILALSKLSSEKTDEAAKQALITGRLMQKLAQQPAFSQVGDYAFITGLLSAIDVLLGLPIDNFVDSMPLADPIKKALIEKSGILGELLTFTSGYITGTNHNNNDFLNKHKLDKNFVQQAFVDASTWCSQITTSLTH